MTRLRSPFVEKPIACPACKTESNQKFFRHRLFVAEEKESDEHVVRYKWLESDVQKVNPAYYVFYSCPHCYFTDTTEDYASTETALSTVHALNTFRKEAHKSILIPFLGQHINHEIVDFESALNLHLLAIHLYLLPDEDNRDHYKLARLYLRVAWLFRERANAPSEQEATQEEAASVQDVPAAAPSAELSDTAQEIASVAERLEETLNAFTQTFQQLQPLVRKRALEIARAADRFEGANPYPGLHMSIEEAVGKLHGPVTNLKGYALRDVSGILLQQKPDDKEGKPSRPRSASIFGSHDAFLGKVQRLWQDAPLSEHQALRAAAEYFQKAMNHDKRLGGFTNYVRIATLVTDLMCRCDDFDGAFDMVRSLYRSALDTRVEMQTQMREPDISEEGKRRMEVLIKRASTVIDTASDMRRGLLDRMFERDAPRIRQIVQRAGTGEIDKILVENGIRPELAQLYKQKQTAKAAR